MRGQQGNRQRSADENNKTSFEVQARKTVPRLQALCANDIMWGQRRNRVARLGTTRQLSCQRPSPAGHHDGRGRIARDTFDEKGCPLQPQLFDPRRHVPHTQGERIVDGTGSCVAPRVRWASQPLHLGTKKKTITRHSPLRANRTGRQTNSLCFYGLHSPLLHQERDVPRPKRRQSPSSPRRSRLRCPRL